MISIHAGCPATTANQLACNEDGVVNVGNCNVLDSITDAQLNANQTVLIRVSHFGEGVFRIGNGRYQIRATFHRVQDGRLQLRR